MLSLVVSWTEICTIGLGSLLPFLICNILNKSDSAIQSFGSRQDVVITMAHRQLVRLVKIDGEDGRRRGISCLCQVLVLLNNLVKKKKQKNVTIFYKLSFYIWKNIYAVQCGFTSLSLSAEDSRESHSSRRWTLPEPTSLRLNHCRKESEGSLNTHFSQKADAGVFYILQKARRLWDHKEAHGVSSVSQCHRITAVWLRYFVSEQDKANNCILRYCFISKSTNTYVIHDSGLFHNIQINLGPRRKMQEK